MRRHNLIATLGLLLALVALTGAHQAKAAEGTGYLIQPLSGTPAAQTGYWILDAQPGERLSEVCAVSNSSDGPIELDLAACDASTAPHGGVAYGDIGAPIELTGAWLSLSRTHLSLQAGQTENVEFRVTVPSDAAPGDHLAGLTAWIPVEPSASPSAVPGQTSAQVTVQMRQVVAVQVVVPGAATAKLEVLGVKPVPSSNGMNLEIEIANGGGLLTKATGSIEVPSTGFTEDFPVGTFVPGTTIHYPVLWSGGPEGGTYEAHVVLHYGRDEALTAEWSGQFTVSDSDLTDLSTTQVENTKPASPETDGSRGRPLLVYGLIVGLVIVIVVMSFALIRRRRPAPKE